MLLCGLCNNKNVPLLAMVLPKGYALFTTDFSLMICVQCLQRSGNKEWLIGALYKNKLGLLNLNQKHFQLLEKIKTIQGLTLRALIFWCHGCHRANWLLLENEVKTPVAKCKLCNVNMEFIPMVRYVTFINSILCCEPCNGVILAMTMALLSSNNEQDNEQIMLDKIEGAKQILADMVSI